jgi:hypothetical protein
MTGVKKSCQNGFVKWGRNNGCVLKAVAVLTLAGWGCGGSIGIESAQGGKDKDQVGPHMAGPGEVHNLDPDAAKSPDERESLAPCGPDLVKTSAVRRLSHTEYNRTVRALFPGLEIPHQEFAADLAIKGFENNAEAMNPSPILTEQYLDAAARIAEIAAGDRQSVLPCMPAGDDMACASAFIAQFGRDAFRRPLTGDEQSRYEAFFALQMGEVSFDAAFELTLQSFLLSPQFLYRLEPIGEADKTGEIVALDDYAMASRLSYLVWQSMPDAELFQAAQNGELHTAAQVEAQARRMLAAPAATDAIVDFHRQWLDFDRLLTEDKDPGLFPEWNDDLQAAMREESDRFVAHVFGAEGTGSVAELLTSSVSFVNADLAALYGVEVAGDGWQQVSLPENERAGLLTRANFLASRAHSTNGSPPLRGVAVLDALLCSRPPSPPPSLDTSVPANDAEAPVTNRELFEARTGVEECQGCHKSINGIGYGLEAFDSIGRFRAEDHGAPVDASGVLVSTGNMDGPYLGAVELSQKLAQSTQLEECAVTHWYRFALGREEKSNDSCKIDTLGNAMQASGGDVRELLVAIATSHEFMHRKVASVE